LPEDEWAEGDKVEPEEIGNAFDAWIVNPVASHVILIAHPIKTGNDIAGHRAIAADTGGLYRVHRFGRITDSERSMAGQITPIRTKGMLKPAPLRFEVEVVTVPGVKRSAAILKTRGAEIGEHLKPVIAALRELVEASGAEEISAKDVADCVDRVAANRTTRMRRRKELEDAGILEAIEGGGFRVHLP
jgi:hypothetical protein